jgi:hypothetical protein
MTALAAAAVPNVSADLITDWANRVIGLWKNSRAESASDTAVSDEFAEACRVRDQLNNRLARVHADDTPCAEQSLDTLRDADAFFLQFTIESSTAEALSRHNHYSRRGEWWWRRQTRLQAA